MPKRCFEDGNWLLVVADLLLSLKQRGEKAPGLLCFDDFGLAVVSNHCFCQHQTTELQ